MTTGKATSPFKFMTRLSLPEITGRSAATLPELLEGIRNVDPGAIFNHTHNFLPVAQYTALELVSDFAFWVKETLREEVLGERLALVNPGRFHHIEEVRTALVFAVERYLADNVNAAARVSPPGQEFHFVKSNPFVFPLAKEADDLPSFAKTLKTVGVNSIFYHAFESKLRHEHTENDFVLWIRDSVGDHELARILGRMDLYSYSLSRVPTILSRAVEERMFLGRLHTEA